jgi:hypothetical protein
MITGQECYGAQTHRHTLRRRPCYSRLMGEYEAATFHTLTSHRKLIDSLIEQHHGRFVGSAMTTSRARDPSLSHHMAGDALC